MIPAGISSRSIKFEKNDRVRLVSDAGGTIWESVFTVKAHGESTIPTLSTAAEPYRFLRRFLVPLMMKGFLTKALAADMDAVKVYCEK
jgi:hypothetical protein